MARGRKPRISETREMQGRDVIAERLTKMNYISPLDVPDHLKRDGYEYRWGRASNAGEQDLTRLTELQQEGWSIVPADRNASAMTRDPLGRNSHMDGYNHYKGLILMERPEYYGQIQRRALNEENLRVMNSMPGQQELMSDPSMPVQVNQQSYMSTVKANTPDGFGG